MKKTSKTLFSGDQWLDKETTLYVLNTKGYVYYKVLREYNILFVQVECGFISGFSLGKRLFFQN